MCQITVKKLHSKGRLVEFINLLNSEVHATHKSNGLVLAGSLLQGCSFQTLLIVL